jgi:hypothetical protein
MRRAGEGPVDANAEPLDEAAAESFPASDPPSWSAAPTIGDVPSGRAVGLGHVVKDGASR